MTSVSGSESGCCAILGQVSGGRLGLQVERLVQLLEIRGVKN